jgi:hypothetical protein
LKNIFLAGLIFLIGCTVTTQAIKTENKWKTSDLNLIGLNEGACTDNKKAACDCIIEKLSVKYPDPVDYKQNIVPNPDKQKEAQIYIRDVVTPACKSLLPTPVPQPTVDPVILNECKVNMQCVIDNTTIADVKVAYQDNLALVEKGEPKEEIETLCNTIKASKENFAPVCK